MHHPESDHIFFKFLKIKKNCPATDQTDKKAADQTDKKSAFLKIKNRQHQTAQKIRIFKNITKQHQSRPEPLNLPDDQIHQASKETAPEANQEARSL